MGASLLALAKSIYYLFCNKLSVGACADVVSLSTVRYH